jgi:hypothetical protein
MNDIDSKLTWEVRPSEADLIRLFNWPEDDHVKVRLLETVSFFYMCGQGSAGMHFRNTMISDVLEFLSINEIPEIEFTYSPIGVTSKARFHRNLVLFGSDWFPKFRIQLEELKRALISATPDSRGLHWKNIDEARPMLCDIIVPRSTAPSSLTNQQRPKILGLYTHRVRPDGSGEEILMFKERNLHGVWPEEVEIHERGEWNSENEEWKAKGDL